MNRHFTIVPNESFMIIPKDKKVTLILETTGNNFIIKISDTLTVSVLEHVSVQIKDDDSGNYVSINEHEFETIIAAYNKIKEHKQSKESNIR